MAVLLAVVNALLLLCVLGLSHKGRSGGKRAASVVLWIAGLVLVLVASDPMSLALGAAALLAGLLLLVELVAGRATCLVSQLWIVGGVVLIWFSEDLGEWLAQTHAKVGALAVVGTLTLSLVLLVREQRRRDKDPYGGAPGV